VTNVLVTTHVTKLYGKTPALKNCSLAVPEGRIAALVGPNGAGKTTLLHLASDCYSRPPGRSASSGDRPTTTQCHRSASSPRTRRSRVTSLHGSITMCTMTSRRMIGTLCNRFTLEGG
jgi:ABC-type branched-subunit amino acid transport system ATPase component